MSGTKAKISAVLGIIVFIVASVVIHEFRNTLFSLVSGVPAYIGIFLISFLGAVSVIVPIPYTAVIFVLAGLKKLNPVLTAIVGGAGSGLGEFTGWIMGRFMNKTLEGTKYSRQIKAIMKFIKTSKGKYIVPFLIFIFALTPLPDDLLFIVLGIIKYNLVHALILCMIGKMVMMYLIAVFGKLVVITGESMGLSTESIILITTVGLAIALIIMLFIPWDRILEKYIGGDEE